MQYRIGAPDTLSTHTQSSLSDKKTMDLNRLKQASSSKPMAGLQTFKSKQPSITVKKEPMEVEDNEKLDKEMVIDLTPRSPHLNSHCTQSTSSYLEHKQLIWHKSLYRTGNDSSGIPQCRFKTSEQLCESESGVCNKLLSVHDRNHQEKVDTGHPDGSTDDSEEMLTGTFRFAIRKNTLASINNNQSRAKREFVPDYKKDSQYWNKREKNNVSARRSRMKRKTIEKLMEHRMLELQQENTELRHQLDKLKKMFGVQANSVETSSASGSSSSENGPSTSTRSSDGSNDHSTNSSPTPLVDNDKPKKVGFQLKVQLASRGNGSLDEESEMESSFSYATSSGSPTTGCSTSASAKSSPPVNAFFSQQTSSPPTAHSNSNCFPATQTSSYLNLHSSSPPSARSSAATSADFGERSPSSRYAFHVDLRNSAPGSGCLLHPTQMTQRHSFGVPNCSSLTSTNVAAYEMAAQSTSDSDSSFLVSRDRRGPRLHHSHPSTASEGSSEMSAASSLPSSSKRDSSPSSNSPDSRSDSRSGASGSPSCPMSSEDDASSGSGWSTRSSRGSLDEERLQGIPLKCRMKRWLHSAYTASSPRTGKDFQTCLNRPLKVPSSLQLSE